MELHNGRTPELLTNLDVTELEPLLQAELKKPTDIIDTSLVQLLLKELELRGKDPNLEDNAAVEQACEKFRKETSENQNGKPRWHQNWIVKVASAVLMLGIFLFSLPSITIAGAIPNILAYWTDSMFQFFSPGKTPNISDDYVFQTNHSGLQRIYDAAIALGISDPIVPMWIPEGFYLNDLQVSDFPEDSMLCAGLKQSEKFIFLSIIVHNREVKFQHEKDNQNIKTYEVAGINHYMISNNGTNIVTWWIDGIECSITTNCQEDVIYKILYSIYTSED